MAAAFASGCALNIGSDIPLPPLAYILLGTGLIAGMAWRSKAYGHYLLVLFLLMGAAGFSVASVHTELKKGPRFLREAHLSIIGKLVDWQIRPDRPVRMMIKPLEVDGRSEGLPRLVRLTVRTGIDLDVVPGSVVQLTAFVGPLSGPAVPGGFDFARKAFFDGIGGQGFSTSDIKLVADRPDLAAGSLGVLEQARQAVADRIMKVLPGQEGAIAVALLVGYRHYLTEETATAFRDAGLAHLMAISGLHMGLVAAAAFFAFEYLFALFPRVALRIPPRKQAAILAWLVAVLYLGLSGMSTATVRAFIMVSIGILAVLVDRRVLSLRSVALAGLAILILSPDAIASAGFQMSFSATAALVTVYEKLPKSWTTRGQNPVMRLLQFIFLSLLTTLVAELAIAPFAIYHFQAVPLVGLGANLAAVPLVSVLVMPCAFLTLLLLPFGFEGALLPALGSGTGLLLEIAQIFSSPNHAVLHVTRPPPAFLVLAALLLMAFVLIKGRAKLPVLLLSAPLLLWASQGPAINILIDNQGQVVAHRKEGNDIYFVSGGRRGGFRDEVWSRYWGISPHQKAAPLPKVCDGTGCDYRFAEDFQISRVTDLSALRTICAEADMVVIPHRWRRYCRGRALIITEEDLDRIGPLGIDSTSRMLYWASPDRNRPWSPATREEMWQASRPYQ